MNYLTDPSYESEYELIRYHPHTRQFRFILHGNSFDMELAINYCPWCGASLPRPLNEEWCKVIKDKLG